MTDMHAPDTHPPGTPAPTTYRIHAHSVAHGEATAELAGITVPFDATWAQPPRGLPGPAELLATAFAACLMKNLARTGVLLDFSYEEAEVEVTARRQDSPPRFVEISYTLRVTTDEPERRVRLMHANLTRFGTVYNTLAAACEIHGDVVVVPPAAKQQPAADVR